MNAKVLAFVGLGLIGLSMQAHAQIGPCYSAEQCRAMRYNYSIAIQRQQDAQAAAQREARRQQIAAERQAAIDADNQRRAEAQAEADRQAEILARQHAIDEANAAQLAAENSPDNKCHDPVVAGTLINDFNSLASDTNTPHAVDIEHLTTRRYDNENVFACRGVFVLTNGMRLAGVLSSRLNVANDPIFSFSTSTF